MSRIVNNTPFTQHVPIILRDGTRTEVHVQPRGKVDLPAHATLAPEAVRNKGIREFTGTETEGKPLVKPLNVEAATKSVEGGSGGASGINVKVVPSKSSGAGTK